VGGDQCTFDGSLALAHLEIDYLQFIIHAIHSIVQLAAVFPEMSAVRNSLTKIGAVSEVTANPLR
jgi:hypothetical protein